MITPYEQLKQCVSVKDAAERYGMDIRRNNMTRCPFHADHHPSCLIADDHFHCFGCGIHGDVITLTAKLFGLSPYQALIKLKEDFGLSFIGSEIAKPKFIKNHSKVSFSPIVRLQKSYCINTLTQYRSLLRNWKEMLAPDSPSDSIDERFIEACQHLDYLEYLIDEYLQATDSKQLEIAQELIKNGTIKRYEQRIKEITNGGDGYVRCQTDLADKRG